VTNKRVPKSLVGVGVDDVDVNELGHVGTPRADTL
jgi:hypothetical protein